MSYEYNEKLISNAKTLRKNMTTEERILWYDFLKRLPVRVRRQKTIKNYIVDFYIAKAKLVIEIDGVQHALPENRRADKERESVLGGMGITVLRYTNLDMKRRKEAVCADILKHLGLTWE